MRLPNSWRLSFIQIYYKKNFTVLTYYKQMPLNRLEKKKKTFNGAQKSNIKKKKEHLKQQLFRETALDPSAPEPSPGL